MVNLGGILGLRTTTTIERVRHLDVVECLAVALLVLVACLIPYQTEALVNPENYTATSPEDLTIEIIERQSVLEGDKEHNWLRARVLAVRKSQTGLKLGDVVEISYERDLELLRRIELWFEEKSKKQGWAGETPPYLPVAPEVGQKLRAYLRLTASGEFQTYEPAANQYSFEPI